jgi:beta-N-acetylhexosaminidase
MGAKVLGVGLTGPELTVLERRILEETAPYAVVLFGRNVVSAEQLKQLVSEVKAIAAEPPLILIDEEGGRVDRLRSIIPGLPSAEAFGEGEGPEELSGWFGRVIGKSLRYFGVDINLAPVLDLRRSTAAKGLERRCFGPDAETVITLAGAFMDGQQGQGVASCLKHFPGIGAGSADPHYGASVIDLPRQTLLDEDLAPYRVLGARAGSVMIGHALYPQLETPPQPATLSHVISTELLRNEVGFKGLAFSDDMEMHSVSDLGSYDEIASRALMAGNDVILFCSQIERIPELMRSLDEKARSNREFGIRFEEAVGRTVELRRHCETLQRSSTPVASFEELLDEVDDFCNAFVEAHPNSGAVPQGGERRTRDRTHGTGKTGREEWT